MVTVWNDVDSAKLNLRKVVIVDEVRLVVADREELKTGMKMKRNSSEVGVVGGCKSMVLHAMPACVGSR